MARGIAMVPGALLFFVALGSLVSANIGGPRLPVDEDWRRAVAFVASERKSTELIVFAPEWIEPLGRLYFGGMMDLGDVARMDGATYQGIWRVGLVGFGTTATDGFRLRKSNSFGAIEVRRFEQDPEKTMFDFLAEFSHAITKGKRAFGPSVRVEEVDFRPRRCIVAEPREGELVTIEFRSISLSAKLVGYVGLADVFTRRDIRSPASFQVAIGGATIIERVVGVDDGWVRFEADTESGDVANVEFRISSSAKQRRVCFAAEVRE